MVHFKYHTRLLKRGDFIGRRYCWKTLLHSGRSPKYVLSARRIIYYLFCDEAPKHQVTPKIEFISCLGEEISENIIFRMHFHNGGPFHALTYLRGEEEASRLFQYARRSIILSAAGWAVTSRALPPNRPKIITHRADKYAYNPSLARAR